MTDEATGIDIDHREIKLLHFSSPTPSLAYIHIILQDGRHFNLYMNKSHAALLHHQSGEAIKAMTDD